MMCEAISVTLVTRPRELHSGYSLTVSGDGGNTERLSCQPIVDTFVEEEYGNNVVVRVYHLFECDKGSSATGRPY